MRWPKPGERFIAPSILASDFARLADEVADVEAAGADWIHVDVMDGHFVPNISIGVPVVRSLRKVTDLPLDVHLMIEPPEPFIEAFAEAGADVITVHVEATRHLDRLVHQIKATGCKAGVALNPATPIGALEHVLTDVDLVLVMTVNPGFGGQSFIETSADKVGALSALREKNRRSFIIQADGGVNSKTAALLWSLGLDVVVAGSFILKSADRIGAISSLKSYS